MGNPGRNLAFGLAGLIVLFAVAAWPTFVNTPPHNFSQNECFDCHFTIPKPEDPRPLMFTRPVSELCKRCHSDLDPLSHVVEVMPPPGMRIPRNMPLDSRGMLTCSTCHDPHREQFDPGTGRKTWFLRSRHTGKQFCLLCHEDPRMPGEVAIFSARGAVTHRRSMARAHGFCSYSEVDPFSELDTLSLKCLGCHRNGDEQDGDRARLGMGVWTHGSGLGLSHPVGTDYETAAWRDRELMPIEGVDPRIKFFKGKTGCCSCHDPYSPGEAGDLVIGDRRSFQELCLACHIK